MSLDSISIPFSINFLIITDYEELYDQIINTKLGKLYNIIENNIPHDNANEHLYHEHNISSKLIKAYGHDYLYFKELIDELQKIVVVTVII